MGVTVLMSNMLVSIEIIEILTAVIVIIRKEGIRIILSILRAKQCNYRKIFRLN